MRYVSLIFCLLFTNLSLFADESEFDWKNSSLYRRNVQHISYETFGRNVIATIECTDNTTWKYGFLKENEIVSSQLQEQLAEDLEVIVSPSTRSPYYYLGESLYSSFKVSLSKESLEFIPTIVSIEKIVVSEAGWFSAERSKNILTLSDNSIWEIEYSHTYENPIILFWDIGQHILVSRLRCSSQYVDLINVDAPYSVTTFPGKPNEDLRYINPFRSKIELLREPS